MKNNQLYYAVTRIHSNEACLLGEPQIERLRQAEHLEGCLAVLREHGWAADESMRVQDIIGARRDQMWSFLSELEGASDILLPFRYEHDFSNLKAVIRLRHTERMEEFGGQYISDYGTLSQQTLKDCGAYGDYAKLPELFAPSACEANRLLLQTGSVQLSDSVLDRALLELLRAEAERRGGAALGLYAAMKADIASIMIAIRGAGMNKPGDFFELALPGAGGLSKQELCAAATKGLDAVFAYLASTRYADCVDTLKSSPSSFQAHVESRLIDAIKPLRHAIGGDEPVVAYMIAKENELNVVRLLLAAKINRFPGEFVSGRLRRMYA